jgi:hypothetical protein
MNRGDGLPNDGRNTGGELRAQLGFATVFRSCVLALSLLFSGPVLAAGFACTQAAATKDAEAEKQGTPDELEEIVINGSKSTRRIRDLGAWLRHLEGQYSYEGYVDLCGKGNAAEQRSVTGKSDCVSLYETGTEQLLSLYCAINVRWPQVQGENGRAVIGGESNLSPAMVVYGVVPELPGIQFMQIDNKGMATHAQGKLAGDTLTTMGSCGMQGSCQLITRITAQPDSKDIVMLVDVEIDSRRSLPHPDTPSSTVATCSPAAIRNTASRKHTRSCQLAHPVLWDHS